MKEGNIAEVLILTTIYINQLSFDKPWIYSTDENHKDNLIYWLTIAD